MNNIERAIEYIKFLKEQNNTPSIDIKLCLALEALQEKAERENPKPLTLEQLKERIGKPVFVVGANPKKREWGIVHNGNDELGGRITLRLDFHSLITLPVNAKVRFYDHEPKE